MMREVQSTKYKVRSLAALQTLSFQDILGRVFLTLSLLCTFYAQGQYFQQEVNYNIEVKLDDEKHFLHAFETIEYINNSDSTLTYLFFHLWPNAYKNDETAMAQQLVENGNTKFYFSKPEDRGFIDSLDFKVNGEKIKITFDKKHIDICQLYLPKPLKPGEKITITTPFRVKIPKGVFSRLGHFEQSYQITQWYPKPAVFDKTGWHAMPYLTQGEFYSEFGSFDVKITLPKNYVVGATGDLQNTEEIAWLNALAEETQKNIDQFKREPRAPKEKFPASDKEFKTLRYMQSNVHDFGWFADKRWHVLKGEVTLPHTKNKVTTWAMFLNHEAHLWKNSIEYINDALHYYSLWNGDYPYASMTAVDGALTAGAGMEYPNITVIGRSTTAFNLETTIMHETGHQWFYGVLGSNERDHAWMDEGINTANQNRYIETKYPNSNLIGKEGKKIYKKLDLDRPYSMLSNFLYLISARIEEDQPIQTHSADFSNYNAAAIVYMKSAISFNYLRSYLGDSLYDNIMQTYYQTWKFKHPQPEDIRKIFEEKSKKDLSWFFDDVIKTNKKIDYKMSSVNKDFVNIKNVGGISAPVSISGFQKDSLLFTDWIMPKDNKFKYSIANQPLTSSKFQLNSDNSIPEINTRNNTIRTHGLFKKVEPIKFQPMFSVERGDRTQIFYTLSTGWNNYDKWMLGLGLYNSFIPSQNFEYQLFPMYSFSSKNVVGYAHVAQTVYVKKSIHTIKMGVNSASFSFFKDNDGSFFSFFKAAPYIDIQFKKKTARSKHQNNLVFKYNYIREDYGSYNIQDVNEYVSGNYLFANNHAVSPSTVSIKAEYKIANQTEDFLKLSLTASKKIKYNEKGSSFSIRGFAGAFAFNNTNNSRYNWRMDGIYGLSTSGALLDYTYDHVFMGRTETGGLLSQQMIEEQGNFKIKTPLGQSNKWITGLNLNCDLPFSKSIGFFADAGYNSYKTFMTDGGAYIKLFGIAHVYIPFIYSQNIQDVPSFSDYTFLERIRFELKITQFNPFKLSKQIAER